MLPHAHDSICNIFWPFRDNNPNSSSLGPVAVSEMNRTKCEACVVSFISHDSSTASDKADTNLRSAISWFFRH